MTEKETRVFKNLFVSSGDPGITLFSDGFPDTFVPWKADHGFVALADDEDVAEPGGEGVTGGVFDVDDVESTGVSDTGLDGTDSSQVTSTNDLAYVTSIEFDPVGDFAGGKVDLNGIADFAVWVGVSDGSSVVGDERGNVVFQEGYLLDPAELV